MTRTGAASPHHVTRDRRRLSSPRDTNRRPLPSPRTARAEHPSPSKEILVPRPPYLPRELLALNTLFQRISRAAAPLPPERTARAPARERLMLLTSPRELLVPPRELFLPPQKTARAAHLLGELLIAVVVGCACRDGQQCLVGAPGLLVQLGRVLGHQPRPLRLGLTVNTGRTAAERTGTAWS